MSERIGSIRMTGHMYAGYMEAYESIDSCGTCDGARCDSCKTQYVVEDANEDKTYYIGYDKDKAEEIAGYKFASNNK